ncbi:hypothetical protein LRP88_15029 [Fusarium phalaenopsidis]
MTVNPVQAPSDKSVDASGIPPGYKAKVGQLQTFVLPDKVTGGDLDKKLGKAIVKAWQEDGILQIAMKESQQALYEGANQASQRFFKKPYAQKAACVDSQTYAGYIASGEELTDGIADYSEIFTVTKDLPLDEPRVKEKWPCHGRCPWPDADLQIPMKQYMDNMMQYLTNSTLPSTPHKVGLNVRERFAFAYFHEPSFQAVVKPLPGYDAGQEPKEGVHYGKHFTNMFMRNYPQRITTQRLIDEGRYNLLENEALRTMRA